VKALASCASAGHCAAAVTHSRRHMQDVVCLSSDTDDDIGE
jgi:hypothetical protein